MYRATTLGGLLFLLVAAFISGVVILSVGYWLSDLAYEADLWPIGAVMRVGLLIFLVTWILALGGLVIGGIGSLFAQDS